MQDSLTKQGSLRADGENEALETLHDCIKKLNDRLMEERMAGEAEEQRLVDQIKKVSQDFRRELDHERKEREAEEDNLATLL
jgi:TPP-dependent pyruvate/acetoin dehydrogenase alpha subunit